jgi:hypothetical protein
VVRILGIDARGLQDGYRATLILSLALHGTRFRLPIERC